MHALTQQSIATTVLCFVGTLLSYFTALLTGVFRRSDIATWLWRIRLALSCLICAPLIIIGWVNQKNPNSQRLFHVSAMALTIILNMAEEIIPLFAASRGVKWNKYMGTLVLVGPLMVITGFIVHEMVGDKVSQNAIFTACILHTLIILSLFFEIRADDSGQEGQQETHGPKAQRRSITSLVVVTSCIICWAPVLKDSFNYILWLSWPHIFKRAVTTVLAACARHRQFHQPDSEQTLELQSESTRELTNSFSNDSEHTTVNASRS